MDIELTRPKQFQDKIRNYQLYINEQKFIDIPPNSSQVISIPDHTKYIQARIDWCSSPKYYLSDTKAKKLVIKNSMGGGFLKALILPLYYITIARKKYLTIEEDNGAN